MFDLKKARARAHILEGLSQALEHISEVIAAIRSCKDAVTARGKLMTQF